MPCICNIVFTLLLGNIYGRGDTGTPSNANRSITEDDESLIRLRSVLLAQYPTSTRQRYPSSATIPIATSKHSYRIPYGSVDRSLPRMQAAALEPSASSIFKNAGLNTELKMQILSLAANLDRGQSYNPTSSDAYKQRMDIATDLVRKLIELSPPLPTSLEELEGEWELVFTNVAHGIFRSSPFFLAIQEAYAKADPPAPEKAELFFKLHELQTCSWGVSKIGRVAQTIDSKKGMLYSWFKLLPTFGGSVITASSAKLVEDRIEMEVEYTTSRRVDGLSGLRPLPGDIGLKIADLIWNIKVPVGAIWKLLPWNKGRGPTCSVKLVYYDGDMRIVEDPGGELFVYTRPVASRPLTI